MIFQSSISKKKLQIVERNVTEQIIFAKLFIVYPCKYLASSKRKQLIFKIYWLHTFYISFKNWRDVSLVKVVVSIGLFWFCFVSFSNNGVYIDRVRLNHQTLKTL